MDMVPTNFDLSKFFSSFLESSRSFFLSQLSFCCLVEYFMKELIVFFLLFEKMM